MGDVSTSVGILAGSSCRFAVKGGGHSPAGGFAKYVCLFSWWWDFDMLGEG